LRPVTSLRLTAGQSDSRLSRHPTSRELSAHARRKASRYVNTHPERNAPNLVKLTEQIGDESNADGYSNRCAGPKVQCVRIAARLIMLVDCKRDVHAREPQWPRVSDYRISFLRGGIRQKEKPVTAELGDASTSVPFFFSSLIRRLAQILGRAPRRCLPRAKLPRHYRPESLP
jgi:hypothetical protein